MGQEINIKIRAQTDELNNNLKNAQRSILDFGKVAETALGFGFANIIQNSVQGMVSFTKESIKLAASNETMRKSFSKLAQDSEHFLEELHNSTFGLVNNIELMASANKALLLGIDQEALPTMFKAAAIVAQAAGRTTSEAIEDITLGIGRQSKLILDNLGIIVNVDSTQQKFADSLGKTVAQLTEQEKTLAFNKAAMEALETRAATLGGVVEEGLNTNIQRMNAQLVDLKTNLGEAFSPAVTAAAGGLNNVLKSMNEETIDVARNIEKIREQQAAPTGIISKAPIFQKQERIKELTAKIIATPLGFKLTEQEAREAARRAEALGAKANTLFFNTGMSVNDFVNNALVPSIDVLGTLQEADVKRNELLAIQEAGTRKLTEQELAFVDSTYALKQGIMDGSITSQVATVKAYDLRNSMVNVSASADAATTGLKSVNEQLAKIASITGGGEASTAVAEFKAARTTQELGKTKISVPGYKDTFISYPGKVKKYTSISDSVGDFILKSNGELIKMNPNDNLIGMQDLGKLGGGGGITVNIGTIQGMDPDMIATALQEKLQTLISTA